MAVKFRIIDLFAGCGGLSEGFMKSGRYNEVAAVEWLAPQVETLRYRMKTKWHKKDADERVMRFDIQREDELFTGWDDPVYGKSKGLDFYVKESGGIDAIIGGPPCQAYSIAGRVRDENGMRNDYRNYLFEHYLGVVNRYQPKFFVFENVPGILSAAPDGTPIVDKIRAGFDSVGYEIVDDLAGYAEVNAADFDVPQNRRRVVIVGLNRRVCKNPQKLLHDFYTIMLPREKCNLVRTVRDAIGDLPPCLPIFDEAAHSKHISHTTPVCNITWHVPRYANLRDMDTFRILEEDLASGRNEYDSKKITELYEDKIGSKSPIHRYHVLSPDLPSTTIIAHLYKDGHRFIHYDPVQQRTITVREAARLQSFPDDFDFRCSRGDAYQMIGNAVPVNLGFALAKAAAKLMRRVYG
ncbi:MAG: DNA cytosine methyltransferase [Kiritimatiellae bacterium]|nr:DNA cytosine methyltransferase [Kiritimatiellia bacterium]